MELADTLARGQLTASALTVRDLAMLTYVEKLTIRPAEMLQDDVVALRDAGFDDPAIGDIAVVAALYAFMNRIVDGLGCSLPRGWDREAQRLDLGHAHPDG